MSLNIKNAHVERLIAEVASLTGESKTEAVRRALEERRDRLARRLPASSRAARLRRFLQHEVWPVVPPAVHGQRLTKTDEERILGYGRDGV
ncbi:MAG: type II toxin-antitoxin system VapB family antitoxin [Gemmatimonadaceae bacterium]